MLIRTRKAFTLLELIVVIIILGILAAIAIPTFLKVIEKTKRQSARRAAESLDREAAALAAFDQRSAGDKVAPAALAVATTPAMDGETYVEVAAEDFAKDSSGNDASGVEVTNNLDGSYNVKKGGKSVTLTPGAQGVSGTVVDVTP